MCSETTSALNGLITSLGRERRNELRVLVNMPGRYRLASKRKLNGDRREFACRVVNLSATAMALAAPVLGPIGERALVFTEALGQLHGAILRHMSTGFVMSIVADQQTRERIATKVSWLAKQKEEPETKEPRRHPRVVPKNPTATILLADGSLVSCLVIDYSASGAAVSADLDPQLGTPLAVGKMVGRVVRRFDEGFAIQFTEAIPLGEIERRLAISPTAPRASFPFERGVPSALL
jgi:PilZ domain